MYNRPFHEQFSEPSDQAEEKGMDSIYIKIIRQDLQDCLDFFVFPVSG
jgi:hypothetical protein